MHPADPRAASRDPVAGNIAGKWIADKIWRRTIWSKTAVFLGDVRKIRLQLSGGAKSDCN
jgi:hypothetical protein